MFEGLDLGTYDLGLHYITDLLYATFLIFAGGLARALIHRVTHRVRLHLAMSLLHLLCNQKLHRRLVQPIGLVDRLSVFKKVHLTISSFLKAVFEAVDR